MIYFNEPMSTYGGHGYVATDPATGRISARLWEDGDMDIKVTRGKGTLEHVRQKCEGSWEERFDIARSTIMSLMVKHGVKGSRAAYEIKYDMTRGTIQLMPKVTAIRVSKRNDEVALPQGGEDRFSCTTYTANTPAGPDVTVVVPRSPSEASAAFVAAQMKERIHAWRCSYDMEDFPVTTIEPLVTDAPGTADQAPKTRKVGKPGAVTPKAIVEALNDTVHGQHEAKEILAIAAYQHARRTQLTDPGFRKSNILMIGPTGSGKTYLAENLAKAMRVPFCIYDVSRITAAGFYGDDVDDLAKAIIASADGDEDKASKAIVVLDEFDKLCVGNSATHKTVDIGGFGKPVQQQLLKFIEGMGYTSSGGPMTRSISLNTRNVLFVLCGAFAHMPTADTTSEWLMQAGMIPELVGRLPVRVILEELSVADMVSAAKLHGGAVEEYTNLLGMDEIKLEISDDALELMAHSAHQQKTGVRGLREIFERVLRPVMFNAPDYRGTTVTLTSDTVFERMQRRA